jgi:hypothetical protein
MNRSTSSCSPAPPRLWWRSPPPESLVPGYGVQIVLQLTIGLAATVFPAATGAFALGMSEKDELTGRVARNETFTHTGNAFFALAAGVVGTLSPWPAYFTRRRYSRPEWPHR